MRIGCHCSHEQFSPGALVRYAGLAERDAATDRRIVRMSGGPDTTVDVDRDQLEQALINLLRNAVDAVEESDGGDVDIAWSAGSGTVEIRITDEGAGIADSPNLFVPFFTTKPGGTGLGLSISRSIVRAHGGKLWCSANPGGGARFFFTLPAVPAQAGSQP